MRVQSIGMVIMLLLSMGVVNSQSLGEVGGYLYFNLTPNSTQTLNWILINENNTSTGFNISKGALTSSTNSAIRPIITYMPLNGIIQANSDFAIAVKVFLPQNIPINQNWSALPTAFPVNANGGNSSGGATLQIGTAKKIFIRSIAPSTTTSSTTSTSSTVSSTSTRPTTSSTSTTTTQSSTSTSMPTSIYTSTIPNGSSITSTSTSTSTSSTKSSSSTSSKSSTSTSSPSTTIKRSISTSTTIIPIIKSTSSILSPTNNIKNMQTNYGISIIIIVIALLGIIKLGYPILYNRYKNGGQS